MRRRRNVKILATLGPASASFEKIRALSGAGVDVFRLNMSHGDHEAARELHATVRAVEAELGRPIGILADLQGPKLRVGVFEAPQMLEVGQRFRLDLDDKPGDARRAPLPHPEIFKALEPGATLLINDGKIRLKVLEFGADYADCEVMVGGEISDRKGVNVPDLVLPLDALTEKDKRDLEFVCELGVEWLALSFVQRPEDVTLAKRLAKGRAPVMVKVEKPACVRALDEVLNVTDAVMVARGDLGVELPISSVPPVQKRIVRAARAAGKPVVVATQMLESMTHAPVPTRAEVSDVANAVFEGADAVMLSGESAVGDYPVEAVKMMDDIARTVEAEPHYRQILEAARTRGEPTTGDAITAAAREVAETARTVGICCFTHSGATAIRAARERPRVPILATTPILATARKLTLVWGLHCVVSQEVTRFKECVRAAVDAARNEGFGRVGDKIIITAGVPFGVEGSTNILRVAEIDAGEISPEEQARREEALTAE